MDKSKVQERAKEAEATEPRKLNMEEKRKLEKLLIADIDSATERYDAITQTERQALIERLGRTPPAEAKALYERYKLAGKQQKELEAKNRIPSTLRNLSDDAIFWSSTDSFTMIVPSNDKEDFVAMARRLQAIARNGLYYSRDPFDKERFAEVQVIAARLAEAALRAAPGSIAQIYSKQDGPATPKVDVRGFVLKDNRVLLVRDRQERLWSLPGGWAEVGLTARQSAEKEILEESGYQVRTICCLAIYDNRLHNTPSPLFQVYKLFFHCKIEAGAAQESEETDAVDFFSVDALPALSLHRTTDTQIRTLYRMVRLKDVRTIID